MSEYTPLIVEIAVLGIGLLAVIIVQLNRSGRRIKSTLAKEGFQNARVYKNIARDLCAAFDDTGRRALFINKDQAAVIPYDEIKHAVLIVQSNAFDLDRTWEDALEGYLLAGKTGAIIGGTTSKPVHMTRVHRIEIRIIAGEPPREIAMPIYNRDNGESALNSRFRMDRNVLRLDNDFIRQINHELRDKYISFYMWTDQDGNVARVPGDYRLPGVND